MDHDRYLALSGNTWAKRLRHLIFIRARTIPVKSSIVFNTDEGRPKYKKRPGEQMPSVKYTRIEITQEAYMALEAEAILQGKTLKKLASEMILKGASKKALNFVQESTVSIEANLNFSRDKLSRVINDIGTTKINIDEGVMENVQKSLVDEGYQGAMLYVAQHMASMQRDELFRILTTCQLNRVPSAMAVDIIKSLKRMQGGK
ncbi:MAG: hypothetical protein NTU95_00315 [Methanothrix sp.]|nr:hypothetical protein [Methanothrix sp.]